MGDFLTKKIKEKVVLDNKIKENKNLEIKKIILILR